MKRALLHALICRAIGCGETNEVGCCPRCHEHLYEGAYQQFGWLTPATDYFYRLKRRLLRRCDVCKKRIRGDGFNGEGYVCSEKCFDDWLPF